MERLMVVTVLNPGNNQIAAFDSDHLSIACHSRQFPRQDPSLQLSQ